jgi:hypothetical protein
MAPSVYTAVIDLGDLADSQRIAVEREIDIAVSDILDEGGFDYHVIVSMVVDGDEPEELVDPREGQIGGFRKTDPETSRKAAVMNYPGRKTQRWEIMMAIAQAGSWGMTAEEASRQTGIEYRSATPRIGELKSGDWIKGKGTTREGSMRAEQEILVLTERAKRYLEVKEGITV